jgi:excinuclease ABC subunit B
MYADRITGSMERAIGETNRRREKQKAHNIKHGITPTTIKKNVEDVLQGVFKADTDQSRVTAKIDKKPMTGANLQAHLDALRKDMLKAAENLEFEEAARIRDEVKRLETVELTIANDPLARQYIVDAAVEDARKRGGRSTGGKGGTRAWRGKSTRKF